MRLVRFIGFLFLVSSFEAAPSVRRTDMQESKELKIYNESLLYNLFLKLMSTGSLKTWINQHVLKPSGTSTGLSFGSQSSSNQGNHVQTQDTINDQVGPDSFQQDLKATSSTPTANLTIERDHDSLPGINTNSPPVKDLTIIRDHMVPTTPFSLQDTTQQPSTGSTKKFTVPVIILTDPDSDKLVDGGDKNENLTIIRDYPVSTPKTNEQLQHQPEKRQKRSKFSIPVLNLNSKSQYNNPSGNDTPPSDSLTDGDDGDLVLVRDKTSLDEPAGSPNPVYTGSASGNNGGSPTTSGSQPKSYSIRVFQCPHKIGWCFELI